jgi:putative ABC transport system permease protein
VLSFRLLAPGLRRQWAQPVRLALVLAGVALGSALTTSIVLINRATLESFRRSVEDLAGETDLSVTSLSDESFSEDVLDQVLKVEGVRSAVPLVLNKASVSFNGRPQRAMTLIGIDLLNDSSVRDKTAQGTRMVADPLGFMASPDSVALTRAFASQNQIKLQDEIRIVTPLGTRVFKVRALVEDTGPGKSFGGALVIMDVEAARAAFAKQAKTDQLNIAVEDKEHIKAVVERLHARLGENFSIDPPSSQVQSLRDLVAPFQKLLLYLGLLASCMAFFLISNTAQTSIAERRREIGILRALGMEKPQVLAMLLSEYSLLGFVGSALGSYGAWALVLLSADTIQQSLTSQARTPIELKGSLMSASVPALITCLGTLVTALAVLIPVFKIAQASPTEAIALEAGDAQRPGKPWRLAVGSLLLLPLALPHLPIQWMPAPLLGAVLCAPACALLLLKVFRPVANRLRSPLLKLAWSYTIENPKRGEKTIRGIVVGLLLVFVIASIKGGFMEGLSGMFLNTSRPDFYVTSNGSFNTPETLQPIDDGLQAELESVAGVRGVYGKRIVSVQYGDKKVKLNALDEVPPETFEIPYSYFEVVDRPVAEAGRELYHGRTPSVFVSESFVSLFGKKTGDTIELRIHEKRVPFGIAGVVRDFTAGGGRIYMSRALYKTLWGDPLVTGIAFVLKKDAKLETVKAEVENRFGKSHGLIVTVDRGNKKWKPC